MRHANAVARTPERLPADVDDAILMHDERAALATDPDQRRAAAHPDGGRRGAKLGTGIMADAAANEAHHAFRHRNALAPAAAAIDEIVDRHSAAAADGHCRRVIEDDLGAAFRAGFDAFALLHAEP